MRTVDTPRFTFGIIEIAPGRELEQHVHADEDDAFYVAEGELTFVFGWPTDRDRLCNAYAPVARNDEDLLLGEAARAIGVSQDTLRRWDRAGKLRTRRDSANRRRVPRREVERLGGHPERHRAGDMLSARNRFRGVVRSVEVDGVMALVEIEAGPHRVTAAITRDAVEELGLAPGVSATAAVKATSVMVERGA